MYIFFKRFFIKNNDNTFMFLKIYMSFCNIIAIKKHKKSYNNLIKIDKN